MARILAIDYGLKRCGIAVTDPFQIIATALTTVATTDLMNLLINYCAANSVERFVVGEAFGHDGEPTHSTPHIEGFVKRLIKQFPDTPISRVDESFTSRMAEEVILQSGLGKMKRRNKALVDKVSAVLILQAYLESKQGL
ncbi:MAG: Holliday junction resolvase RuvX [Bacteroidota bacterium]|nr:Holliday junction resolvase RuvX [Bacteroidota bacterium]